VNGHFFLLFNFPKPCYNLNQIRHFHAPISALRETAIEGVNGMIPLTAVTAAKSEANPWLGAVYAGVFTAIGAIVVVLATVQTENWIMMLLAHILVGIGPVLGYQMARGRIGSNWMAILGGAIGAILPVLIFLIWPLVVGLLDKSQSIGRLYLASLVGVILGIIVFLLLGTVMGQNPSWVGTGFTFLMAVWGGAIGAFGTAYARD
jgi:hypothetical protein